MGPEVVNVVRPSQRRRDQVVHLVSSRVRPGDSVFLEHLPLHRRRNGFVLCVWLCAHRRPVYEDGCAGREPGIRESKQSRPARRENRAGRR